MISVASGANACLMPSDIDAIDDETRHTEAGDVDEDALVGLAIETHAAQPAHIHGAHSARDEVLEGHAIEAKDAAQVPGAPCVKQAEDGLGVAHCIQLPENLFLQH